MQRRDSPPARRETAHRCLYLCKDRHFSYKIRCIRPIFRIEGSSAGGVENICNAGLIVPFCVCANYIREKSCRLPTALLSQNGRSQTNPKKLFALPKKVFPKSKIFFTMC